MLTEKTLHAHILTVPVTFFRGSTFSGHYIGLSDDKREGVWRWLDGSQLPWDWAFWGPGEPSSGFLKSYVILQAHVTPQARTALQISTSTNDLADFVICEYVGGKSLNTSVNLYLPSGLFNPYYM